MCTANSRRICVLCMFLYCFTCVRSARNPYVPRRPVVHEEVTTERVQDAETVTDAYYMEKDFFVNELMKKYGDGKTITYEGLEDLLYHLGVGGIDKLDLDKHVGHDHSHDHGGHVHYGHSHDDHSGHDHLHDDHSGHDHSHDDHSGHDLSHDDHSGHDHSSDDHSGHDHSSDDHDLEVRTHSIQEDNTQEISVKETNTFETETSTTSEHDPMNDGHNVRRRSLDQSQCFPAETLVKTVKKNVKDSFTKAEFKELCPSLIHQIDANACHSHASGDHDHFHGDGQHDHHDHDHHELEIEQSKIGFANVPAKVWGYSTIAVILISLVGLFGVAVIPIMQKVFYNHLLQFLVALAVGALSGDALLHLIPHAMGGHEHGAPQEDEHGNGSHDHGSHDHGSHSHGSHDHDPTMIYKGLCALMGIYFFFWTERLLTIYTDAKRRKKEMKKRAKKHKPGDENGGPKLTDQCDGMMMSIHPNKGFGSSSALQDFVKEAHDEHCSKEFDDEFVSHRHGPCPNNDIEAAGDGEESISMIDDGPKVRHGHGHSHGIDGVPTSVASVAWMVIIGDGIHNFCDGLAIGAAFVNSITGGFSTSIAVLCHELPHEIGDFAMLLRAGMSAKQAVIYNCVSSILCFFGMLVGVAIGNVGGASLWVFTTVGGMFLYIGMVDMLPELSAVDTKKGEHPLCHLLLQIIGMLLGAGVMLAIALYEENLMTVLE